LWQHSIKIDDHLQQNPVSQADISTVIEEHSATNLKRTWVNYGMTRVLSARDYLDHATETKVVWIPFGEG